MTHAAQAARALCVLCPSSVVRQKEVEEAVRRAYSVRHGDDSRSVAQSDSRSLRGCYRLPRLAVKPQAMADAAKARGVWRLSTELTFPLGMLAGRGGR